MRRLLVVAAAAAQFVFLPVAHGDTQQNTPVEHYRLVPGFVREQFGADGMAQGTGFAQPNPWGAYTAYLLTTNGRGQRTWRIENYLPNPNGLTAQGSSMYLFEGGARALLVDTAQNTEDAPGQPTLKDVVRHLLGHENDGRVRTSPVDFVVANTHSHGDHTGKNALMSDRTVYYPDLDWPRNGAPANYVAIKEGGGPSAHGSGTAVGEIDLGGRTIVAINLHAHTPGSMGYLDRENRMMATGDAIGSAYVWAHFGLMTQYLDTVRHLQRELRPLGHVDVLPAHFYQVRQGARGGPPINGRPLDELYVDDQVRAAEGILDGSLAGEPYRVVGRNAAIATLGSAQIVYTLANLYPGGVFASKGDRSKYHAVSIPGPGAPAVASGRYAPVDGIRSSIHLIRDYGNQTMYLVAGSSKALLIGTGEGTPGVLEFVRGLAPGIPVEAVVTSEDPGQVGGLSQFADIPVYLPRGMTTPARLRHMRPVGEGDRIELGVDRAGRPLVLDVHTLVGHSQFGITLLDATNRVLFSGDALGTQGNDAGLVLAGGLPEFGRALSDWRARTDGKYDVVYTAHNYQWFTPAAYVDEVQAAVAKGIADGPRALIDSVRIPGAKMIRSSGGPEVVASIVLTQ
jgi:glyoxylase-like metal-dependent hydrolase (beta-lactamase superfamily II)